MVEAIQDNGKMDLSMEMEFFIIKEATFTMKENGNVENHMVTLSIIVYTNVLKVKEKFTMSKEN